MTLTPTARRAPARQLLLDRRQSFNPGRQRTLRRRPGAVAAGALTVGAGGGGARGPELAHKQLCRLAPRPARRLVERRGGGEQHVA
jgi:hypothetical protein